MLKKISKPVVLYVIKNWTTYALLIWHLIMWIVLAMFVPDYWVLFLVVCIISYLVANGILIYWHIKWNTRLQTSDRIFAPAFQIANEAFPLLSRGLNEETAEKVAEIIQKISDVSAVAITDREKVLAFLGTGCENHLAGMPIGTQATLDAINTGELRVVKDKRDFNCKNKECCCPLESVVIAPLTFRGNVTGVVKLYQTTKGEIPRYLIKLAKGIARLLSMQMELAELDHQAKLVTEAKLDALQAQINPHFLFNTLNTIGMLTRTNPNIARRLLYRLSSFFRYSLRQSGRFVTLKEEIKNVRNYLILEKARFRDKLKVVRKVDKELLECKIPIFSIQPLVENAIRHGITPKEGNGTIEISACMDGKGNMEITVGDDGLGISPEIMPRVLEPGFGSGSGVGLSNVNERLKIIYGDEYGLQIWSKPNIGTVVKLIIPNCSGTK